MGDLGVYSGREGPERGIKCVWASKQTQTQTLDFAIMHHVEYNQQLSGCCRIATGRWFTYLTVTICDFLFYFVLLHFPCSVCECIISLFLSFMTASCILCQQVKKKNTHTWCTINFATINVLSRKSFSQPPVLMQCFNFTYMYSIRKHFYPQ